MHTCSIELEPDPHRSHHDEPSLVAAKARESLVTCVGVEHLTVRTSPKRIRLTAFLHASGAVAALPLISVLRARLSSSAADMGGWRLIPDHRSRP